MRIKSLNLNLHKTILDFNRTEPFRGTMNSPESYVQYHGLQYRDNVRCLTEHLGRVVWRGADGRRAERVLDVGSGDGRFAAEDLRRALPSHCELVGFDKCRTMVDHATAHHSGAGATFELVEIGKPLPNQYVGAFDHIFSFFCYHWIPDQRTAFAQTYDMLTDGGDCLLLMVADCPIIFDMYQKLIKSDKWGKYITNLDDFISPYHDCEDPDTKLKKYAEDAGLKDVYVENNKLTYTFATEQNVKTMLISLNPFQIPEELMEEYLQNFIRVAKEEGYLTDTLTINYSTNTLYAKKY